MTNRHALSRRNLLGLAGTAAAFALGGGVAARALRSGPAVARTLGGVPVPTSTPTPTPAAVLPSLTPQQRVGQLFMVGLSSDASNADLAQLNRAITASHAGNLVLFGTNWSSAATVQSAVAPLQTAAATANGGVQLFVSGNQEGGDPGTFQAFYGQGFSTIPSPTVQAQGDPAALQAQARGWGNQLLSAGVNLDLAPVLDTVPAAMLATNDPIAHWNREYGTDPQTVATYGVAFEQGMRAGGIAVCIKHFPGLGRVTGNTDFTAEGIVDDQFSGANDPYLQPYQAGIAAGADFVMVSLAVYPQVDTQPAVFSSAMITGILRGNLDFQNVVITDDVGAAAAVADRAPGDRAVDFLRAGGDMVLTVDASVIAPMTAAVMQAMAGDASFAAQVNASVDRILRRKAAYGLLPAARGS